VNRAAKGDNVLLRCIAAVVCASTEHVEQSLLASTHASYTAQTINHVHKIQMNQNVLICMLELEKLRTRRLLAAFALLLAGETGHEAAAFPVLAALSNSCRAAGDTTA
jgi:hypothetical protein